MPRVLLLLSTGGFAAGLILGEYLSIPWPLILVMVTVIWSTWSRRARGIVILTMFMLLGVMRTHQSLQSSDRAAETLILSDQPVTGFVTRVTERYGRQEIEVMHLNGLGGGRITSFDIVSIRPGDEVQIDCRWALVATDQQRRWQSQGLLAECRQPENIQPLGQGSGWRSRLARVRGEVVGRVQQQYRHPQSDLLAGVLLGVQDTMSAELRQNFRATGTAHIVALSGFNVTIIITIVAGTLAALIGRRLAWWPTIGLVIGFVVMTGASASVVRAAVMAVIVMLGQQLGRPVAMSRILAYTFILITAVNPLILRYDLGFQLSFLATIGLVYISPGFTHRLRWLPEAGSLRSNLSSTLAAMAATEPLLLWTFGRFSLVAPVVNSTVLPFIPLIMATGAIALIVPAAVPVTDALLRLVLWVITTAGSWSFAQAMTPWWVAGGIASLAALVIIRFSYAAQKKDFPR